VLARLREPRCKQDETAIAQALYGTWRDEHLFALQQALERYEFQHRHLAACDARIAAHLATFADQSHGAPLPSKRGQRRRHRNRSCTRLLRIIILPPNRVQCPQLNPF